MRTATLLLSVVGHTLVIYVFLICGFTVLGRRQMAQLTLVDYLIIALLGSAVETGLYLGTGSFWAGLVSAASLLVANRLLSLLVARVPAVRTLLVGVPVLLVREGEVIESGMRRAHITRGNLVTAIRRRGYEDVGDVRFAVMEPGGDISVVPRETARR